MQFDGAGYQNRAGYDDLATDLPQVSAAPEPGTWMMMILGFGLIGGMLRAAYRKPEKDFTATVRSLAAA